MQLPWVIPSITGLHQLNAVRFAVAQSVVLNASSSEHAGLYEQTVFKQRMIFGTRFITATISKSYHIIYVVVY